MAWMITSSGPMAASATFTYKSVGEASSLWVSAGAATTTLMKSIDGTNFTDDDDTMGGTTPAYVVSAPVLKFTAPGTGDGVGVSIAEWVRDPA